MNSPEEAVTENAHRTKKPKTRMYSVWNQVMVNWNSESFAREPTLGLAT